MRLFKLRRRRDEIELARPSEALPTDIDDGSDLADIGDHHDKQLNTDHRDSLRTVVPSRTKLSRVIAFGLLPAISLLMAAGAGFLKWQTESAREGALAQAESVRAASDITMTLLSYKPETVQKDLETARNRLTGSFLDAYTQLTNDVVIPGSQQKQIAATATVPAAASVRATADHAVVLLFVNQSVTIGKDAPTSTASSVRVTLDRVDGQWRISQFEPV